MQITRQTEYAIRTVLELAVESDEQSLPMKTISARQDIPVEFLKKTVQLLSLAGLINTRRGTQGGITLAKDPGDIYISDIIEAIEGPIAFNVCLEPGDHCPNRAACSVSPLLARAQAAFVKELKQDSLADLARKARRR